MGKILKLLISILICQGAGILGSIFTTPSIPTWYRQLIKPPFTPPNWLFAPAWTLLFLLMGISLYLVWEKGLKDKEVKKALLIFLIQLVLNILWSFIFFTLKSLLFAFIEIVILWIAI
ncbi:MAG: TspO/MBR family protein, partial [candidate division WOR-3 bacterium]|nr:TspO/MBR family protein [candidate division WOR-3 bacterium]